MYCPRHIGSSVLPLSSGTRSLMCLRHPLLSILLAAGTLSNLDAQDAGPVPPGPPLKLDVPPVPTAALSPDIARRRDWKSQLPSFLGGALLGLVIHESGHLAMDAALNAHPYIKQVEMAGIPFFAVSYQKDLSPRQQYAVSSAGFWMQHGMAEVILAQHPHLWVEDAPAAKGAFVFHLVTSLIYSYAALAKSGPPERDTLGMAQGLRINERWVGLAVLAPAALDLYRSFYPETAWARWGSRSVKVSFVLALTR